MAVMLYYVAEFPAGPGSGIGFPDMQRDQRIEHAALNHGQVHIIWGLDHLGQDLERVAKAANFRRPPEPSHSENECRRVNRLQFRGP